MAPAKCLAGSMKSQRTAPDAPSGAATVTTGAVGDGGEMVAGALWTEVPRSSPFLGVTWHSSWSPGDSVSGVILDEVCPGICVSALPSTSNQA